MSPLLTRAEEKSYPRFDLSAQYNVKVSQGSTRNEGEGKRGGGESPSPHSLRINNEPRVINLRKSVRGNLGERAGARAVFILISEKTTLYLWARKIGRKTRRELFANISNFFAIRSGIRVKFAHSTAVILRIFHFRCYFVKKMAIIFQRSHTPYKNYSLVRINSDAREKGTEYNNKKRVINILNL